MADELHLGRLATTRFAALVLERGLPHTARAHWATTADSLDTVLPHALSTVRTKRTRSALLDLEPLFGSACLALVALSGTDVAVDVAAAELVAVADIEAWLRKAFPVATPAEREVPVTFWSYGSCGTSITRKIGVAAWAGVARNYPHAVRTRLAPFLEPEYRPAERGQLMLWYGAPGTGKTHALRALAWEWREWCDLHYVVDPEVLFGERADYLLDVVLDDYDDDPERWRLLVLGDTGELLAADAKERTGQGLARLLNLVDGIVGQGLRVLVLVTTNEPLRRLHPAVARPGRCAAQIEFLPFPADEARAWLADRAVHADVGAATLANLFARLRGDDHEDERPIGFGM